LGGDDCDKNHDHIRIGIGTTEILCLNRKMYREAIGLILAKEQKLFLRNDARKMFRKMFAFGKPGFFRRWTHTSQCPVPQHYCELNMVGLRYLAITLRYPLAGRGQYMDRRRDRLMDILRSDNYEERMNGLLKSARETEAMLWKCRSLQTLRIVLQTERTSCWVDRVAGGAPKWVAITEEQNPKMVELLSIFLNAATCKKFLTAAEKDKQFVVRQPVSPDGWDRIHIESYHDRLVPKYNLRAEELYIRATFDENWENSYVKFEHEVDVPQCFSSGWFGATKEPGVVFEDAVEETLCNENSGHPDDTGDQEETIANELNSIEGAQCCHHLR
jgi:hypothetical protein